MAQPENIIASVMGQQTVQLHGWMDPKGTRITDSGFLYLSILFSPTNFIIALNRWEKRVNSNGQRGARPQLTCWWKFKTCDRNEETSGFVVLQKGCAAEESNLGRKNGNLA